MRVLNRGKLMVLAAVAWLACTCGHGIVAATEEDDRAEAVARVQKWSDKELEDRLAKLLKWTYDSEEVWFLDDPEYEPCLCEIIRRERPGSADFLKKQFDELMAARYKWGDDKQFVDEGSQYNFELLTALRRIRKQPDPLVVFVDLPQKPLKTTTLALPSLRVSVKNVDVEKTLVGFKAGGDYRSGRQDRWKVNVTNSEGELVSLHDRPGRSVGGLQIVIRGGLYQRTTLEPKDSWGTTLELRKFMRSPTPGRYTVEILYHNNHVISDVDTTGLIVARSKPFLMIVEKAVIELTKSDERKAAELISQLPADAPLKIVAGTYGRWAHKFIEPDSTAGKLLAMGLKGVPALANELENEKLPANKRAWILSLLFSATGEHDLRRSVGFASYKYIDGPWQVWGGKKDGSGSGGIGFSSENSSEGGEIGSEVLDRLSKKWRPWLNTYCDVRVLPDEE